MSTETVLCPSPFVAMHAIRELCGVLDHQHIKGSFAVFYGA